MQLVATSLDLVLNIFMNAPRWQPFSSIRDTWPNQVNLLLLILSIIVSFCCKVSLMSIFFILPLLVTWSIFLSQVISAVRIFLSSSLRRHQHSDPYCNTGTTNVSYNLTVWYISSLTTYSKDLMSADERGHELTIWLTVLLSSLFATNVFFVCCSCTALVAYSINM